MTYRRTAYAIILLQDFAILGLLLGLLQESKANPFMNLWISQHVPILLLFLTEGGVLATAGALFTGLLIFILIPRVRRNPVSEANMSSNEKQHNPSQAQSHGVLKQTVPKSVSFYESVPTERLVLVAAFVTQAIAMWFVTAADVQVASFPPDSCFSVDKKEEPAVCPVPRMRSLT